MSVSVGGINVPVGVSAGGVIVPVGVVAVVLTQIL